MLELSRYIHRNPVRAKMVEGLGDYQWSSYRFFIGNRKRPAYLETSFVKSMLRGGSYKQYVESCGKEGMKIPLEVCVRDSFWVEKSLWR